MKWINSKEKYPEYNSDPFLGIVEGQIAFCQFGENKDYFYFCFFPADHKRPFDKEHLSNLEYWMPLPKAPKLGWC